MLVCQRVKYVEKSSIGSIPIVVGFPSQLAPQLPKRISHSPGEGAEDG